MDKLSGLLSPMAQAQHLPDAGTNGSYLCLGDMEPRQAFLWEILSPRLKPRSLIERPDMEMRFRRPGETFARQR